MKSEGVLRKIKTKRFKKKRKQPRKTRREVKVKVRLSHNGDNSFVMKPSE